MFEDEFISGFAVVVPGTPVSDGAGGYTETPVTTSFNGVMRKLRGYEKVEMSKRDLVATHRIYCPVSVTIPDNATITYNSISYDVVRSNDVMMEGLLQQVDINEQS